MNEKHKKIDLAKRWIAALRSGKYKQGKEYLVKDGKYCCLGVLCDVAKEEFKLNILFDGVQTNRGDVYTEMLPTSIKDYMGLGVNYDNEYEFQNKLIQLNDGSGEGKNRKRFTTIAKFLETELLPILENE